MSGAGFSPISRSTTVLACVEVPTGALRIELSGEAGAADRARHLGLVLRNRGGWQVSRIPLDVHALEALQDACTLALAELGRTRA